MLLAFWILPVLIFIFILLYIFIQAEQARSIDDRVAAQRWTDRRVPTVFFGVAILLTFYAILVRVEEDVASQRVNSVTSIPISGYTLDADYTLFILHPSLIRADTDETTPLELVLWLESTAGNSLSDFTIEMSSDKSIIFINENNIFFRFNYTLIGNDLLQTRRFNMRPVNNQIDDRTTINVNLTHKGSNQNVSKEIMISNESRWDFFLRMLKNRFFGDVSLILAIASAVFGFGLQLRNEQQQKRLILAQQSERIREIRDLFDQDPVEWYLSEVKEVIENNVYPDWEDETRGELERTIKEQRKQLTKTEVKEKVKHLLHDAAEYYRTGDDRRLNAILALLKLAYSDVFQEIADLQLNSQVLQDIRKALDICAVLLHRFQLDAYEFVVVVIERLVSVPESSAVKQSILPSIRLLKTKGAVDLEKLIGTDPRIRRHLVEELPWSFAWPPLVVPQVNKNRTQAISTWLETNGLHINPFDPEELQGCQKFLERVTLPHNLQQAIIGTSIIGCRFDCRIAAFSLYNANRLHNPTKPCMPVLIVLSDFDPAIHVDMIHFIGRAMSEQWYTALAQQPGLLLWLPEDEQALLAEWLLWSSGSQALLQRQLRLKGLPTEVTEQRVTEQRVTEQIVFSRLNELLSRAVPKSLDVRMMLEFLRLRPPGIERTHLIVLDDVGGDCARQFARLMPVLQRAGIGCTLFVASPYTDEVRRSGSIQLRWSAAELLSLLDSAVAAKSKSVQHLVDLVEVSNHLDPEHFLLNILQQARGSFAHSLTIFQRALANHLVSYRDQQDPAYRFLNENDFR